MEFLSSIFEYRKALVRLVQCFFLLCSFVSPIFSRDNLLTRPPIPRLNSNLITRFGFKQLYGGVILLKAKLGNSTDSLNFILDTGSGGISLDSATASGFNIPIVSSDMTVNGIAGRRKVGFIYGQELRFPGLIIDSLDFYIIDYDILTSFYGEKIDGIIGYTVLKNFIIKLDYDSSIISFYSRTAMKYPKGGFLLKPRINFQPFQPAALKDTRKIESNFILDIGANICLMLSDEFDRDSIPIKVSRKRFDKDAEGVGGKIAIQTTVIREFKLGPYKFKDVPVCIFDDRGNVTDYPYCAGLIGNELLRRFNLILNYGKGEIYLMPNSHFSDPFDYAYTGIELCYVKGLNLIGDITAGSPAEIAGLKEGDVVLGINDIVGHSLSEFKDALMKSTGKIRMIIIREGKIMEFRFKIKSIL
jgi:hypothetical protein